ncbi:MAG: hypothetical protein GY754_47320 [bacterium]|nr:hypothetical protein [bacterium]
MTLFIIEWKKQMGSPSNDCTQAIDLDSSGNIHITGYTAHSFDGESDLLYYKYSTTGEIQNAQQLTAPDNDAGYGLTIDTNDYVYITGHTSSSLEGNTNAGGSDMLLMKLFSSGKLP